MIMENSSNPRVIFQGDKHMHIKYFIKTSFVLFLLELYLCLPFNSAIFSFPAITAQSAMLFLARVLINLPQMFLKLQI